MSGPGPGAGPSGPSGDGMSRPGGVGIGMSGPGDGGCGVPSGVAGLCPAGSWPLLAVLMVRSSYLGSTRGSPPGVPGGGITGMVPGFGFGAGAWMPGSTPAGGRITPPGVPEPGPRAPEGGGLGPGSTRSGGTGPAGGGPGGSCRCAGPGCANAEPRKPPPISRTATAPTMTQRERSCGLKAAAIGQAIIVGDAAPVGRIGPRRLAGGVAGSALQLLATDVHHVTAEARVVSQRLPR